jgi:cytochrome c oxidase subunit II
MIMEREFSATHAVGPQAARIENITWFLTWLCTAIAVIVIAALLYAVWHGRRNAATLIGEGVERQMRWWVGGAAGATALILIGILLYNLATGRALAAFADPSALTIHVTGHQWWWEVEYRDPLPNRRLATANEIHIPVGRKIRLEVESRDVIHSFWAPNVHGKIDLIPGYSGTTYFRVDTAGTYHGRCAEFCGLQHAHMDFFIIAHEPNEFAAWFESQLRPAPSPGTALQAQGKEVFLSKTCSMCHAIRGTSADSRIGPDLTHLASRHTLAAGKIPNTRGHLAGWILDPQRIKPGVLMPPNQLKSDELRALLSYLESLK